MSIFGYVLIKKEELENLRQKAKINFQGRIDIHEWFYKVLENMKGFCFPFSEYPPSFETSKENLDWIIRQQKICKNRIEDFKRSLRNDSSNLC